MKRLCRILCFGFLICLCWPGSSLFADDPPNDASPTPAEDTPDSLARDEKFEVKGDRIRKVDAASGKLVWEVVHPAAREKKTGTESGTPATITEPIELDSKLYYGLGNWLIRLNPARPVIEGRTWFPAEISRVQATDGALNIRLKHPNEVTPGSKPHQIDIQYRPDDPGPQEVWDTRGLMTLFLDVSNEFPGINSGDYHPTSEERAHDLKLLEIRQEQEPNNPYYDYYRGVLLAQKTQAKTSDSTSKNEKEARRAFERAAQTPDLHWTTLFSLSTFLDRAGQYDLADETFARAQKIAENDPSITVSTWSSLVGQTLLMGWSRPAIEAARAASDFEAVDRMVSRLAETFDGMEQSPLVFKQLAGWFDANDQTELSKKWRMLSKNRHKIALMGDEHIVRADLADLSSNSLLLGLLLAAFIIGVRRADPTRGSFFRTRPSRAEAAGLVVTLLLLFGALSIQTVSVQKIEQFATMPAEVLTGAWSSPNTYQWVENLNASPARDELLSKLDTLGTATRTGTLADKTRDLPSRTLLMQAIQADTRADIWTAMLTGGADTSASSGQRLSLRVMLLLVVLLAALLSFGAGSFLGTRFGGLRQPLQILIPGGAPQAGFFTPLIAASVVTGINALFLGRAMVLRQVATADYGRFYGLKDLPDYGPADPFTPYYWLILIAGIAVHCALVFWMLKRQRNQKTASPEHRSPQDAT